MTIDPSTNTQPLILTCSADGTPDPTYSWVTPNGNDATADPSIDVQQSGSTSVLFISANDLDDVLHNGVFVCIATNAAGFASASADIMFVGELLIVIIII